MVFCSSPGLPAVEELDLGARRSAARGPDDGELHLSGGGPPSGRVVSSRALRRSRILARGSRRQGRRRRGPTRKHQGHGESHAHRGRGDRPGPPGRRAPREGPWIRDSARIPRTLFNRGSGFGAALPGGQREGRRRPPSQACDGPALQIRGGHPGERRGRGARGPRSVVPGSESGKRSDDRPKARARGDARPGVGVITAPSPAGRLPGGRLGRGGGRLGPAAGQPGEAPVHVLEPRARVVKRRRVT